MKKTEFPPVQVALDLYVPSDRYTPLTVNTAWLPLTVTKTNLPLFWFAAGNVLEPVTIRKSTLSFAAKWLSVEVLNHETPCCTLKDKPLMNVCSPDLVANELVPDIAINSPERAVNDTFP